MGLTVQEFVREKASDLELEVVAGQAGLDRTIAVWELNRPGLALGGFFENFRWDRIQVIGRGEYAYLAHVGLKQSPEAVAEFFKFKIPCMILSHRMSPTSELLELANRYQVPMLVSGLETSILTSELTTYLEEKLSPTVTVHAVLVDAYGLGVLISGESGIGKSECALELIKRGHMLVADDVVQVQHRTGGILIGKPANEMMKHHMEVRGLGIIDVKQLFGMSSVLNSAPIELVVHLEMWDPAKEYDRLGLEDHSVEILGVRVPKIIMPVRPGRNLAILIEVSALYQRLKAQGVHSARDMERNLVQALAAEPGTDTPTLGTLRSESVTRQSRVSHGRNPYRRR